MKKRNTRYVMVDTGYDAVTDAPAGEAGADAETEIEDESDLRLECLKLAVAFAKTKDQAPPIAIAKQFLAFVLAQEPAAPGGDGSVSCAPPRP
jgi:hypothetical protein